MKDFPTYQKKLEELTKIEESQDTLIKSKIKKAMEKPGTRFQCNIPHDTPSAIVNNIIKSLEHSGWKAIWKKEQNNISYVDISPSKNRQPAPSKNALRPF